VRKRRRAPRSSTATATVAVLIGAADPDGAPQFLANRNVEGLNPLDCALPWARCNSKVFGQPDRHALPVNRRAEQADGCRQYPHLQSHQPFLDLAGDSRGIRPHEHVDLGAVPNSGR